MSKFRGRCLALFTALAAAVTLVAFAVPAQAFLIQNHESITRAALPADQVSPAAFQEILVGPPPGAGVVGSDAFFSDNFRHLDSARNPGEICGLATQAWSVFSPIIQNGSRLVNGQLADGPAARAAFGGLLHVQQDFYAHSNFVELSVAAGQPERLAPSIFPTCDPGSLPAGLYTGYFDVTANHSDLLSGCPAGGPPPGFQECHSMLNKDSPNTQRGAQPAAGTSMTMYALAALLATRSSTALFDQIKAWVTSTNGPEAAALLFQSSGGPGTTEAAYDGPGK